MDPNFPNTPIFSHEDSRKANTPMGKLVRDIFFTEFITHKQYRDRYISWWKKNHPSTTRVDFNKKAESDRVLLVDSDNLSTEDFLRILQSVGFTIKDHSLTGKNVWISMVSPNGISLRYEVSTSS